MFDNLKGKVIIFGQNYAHLMKVLQQISLLYSLQILLFIMLLSNAIFQHHFDWSVNYNNLIRTRKSMSLQNFKNLVVKFTDQLKIALNLQEDDLGLLAHRKVVLEYIQNQSDSLSQKKQAQKKNQSLFSGILSFAGMNDSHNQILNQQNALERLKDILKDPSIHFEPSELLELQIPQNVFQSLKKLNNSRLPSNYGTVSGPLIQNVYLKTKQDLDNCIKKVYVNDLKFVSLGSDPNNIIKHQRMLLEQLFDQLFNNTNQISTVIKIQVQKDNFDKSIEIFCYVQWYSQRNLNLCKHLGQLKIDSLNQQIYVQSQNTKLKINNLDLMRLFMNQILCIPFQTIVSDYVISINQKQAKIMKFHQQTQHKDLSFYIKEHPSLRNPLFYFAEFIKTYEFTTKSLLELLSFQNIFSNFYQILNILFSFMKKDFYIRTANGKVYSLFISIELYENIWKIFHQIVILSHWIEEIISPIKSTVTLVEINSKLCPIFNQLLQIPKKTYEVYQKTILNFPIENYLTLNVSKITIQKYKDRFININTVEQSHNERQILDIFFEKSLKNYDISSLNIYEIIYFLNFISKNDKLLFKAENMEKIPHSWKSRKVWKEIMKIINKSFSKMCPLSISIEILGFYFGYDTIDNSNNPFDAINNDDDNPDLLSKIQILTQILRIKFPKKYDKYLSILIQKSFKYEKYRVVDFLIKIGAKIQNYRDLFRKNEQQPQKLKEQRKQHRQKRQKSISLMKNRQPQMFRKYLWQQILNLKLKSGPKLQQLNILRRGKLQIHQSYYKQLTLKRQTNNLLSRRDYLFSNKRSLGKFNIDGVEIYQEVCQYPLLRYFYSLFFEKIDKSSLLLNYCGFVAENGQLVHLIQSLPCCQNMKNILTIDNHSNISKIINSEDLSQSIIISLMLMPTNILFKNILISQTKNEQKWSPKTKSVIIDFHDFYQKVGFQSNIGNFTLKVKNSLFLFDDMKQKISSPILKKYSSINVMQILNSVFQQSAELIKQVNRLKTSSNLSQEDQQLLSIIFQPNFCEVLAQRMFKIKQILSKCHSKKQSITHLQLLQLINPPLAYFYTEILESTTNLLQRQKLLNDVNFKKSFIVNQKMVDFFANQYESSQSRDTFPNHYKKFVFQGPTENLANFNSKISKFDIYSKKIIKISQYNHSTIQYFIENIDFSIYQKDQRYELIEQIQKYSNQYLKKTNKSQPLSIFRIAHVQFLKQKNLIFSGERLKNLSLEDLQTSQGEINAILIKYSLMRTLYLKRVNYLQKIGGWLIAVSDTYDLKNLKFLTIIDCKNLINIDLKCEQLQQAHFRNNCNLSQIYIFSRNLKNMDCNQCPKLRLQNIGIYILKRINVLLSENSCDGLVTKMKDSNYSIFLTRILRYLFNCIEQSNVYKVQLIMTLVKLELIDEKVLGFRHNQMYNKSFMQIVAKLGTAILNLVVSQIFDIFLRNQLVDLLQVDELLKIDIARLQVIENHFLKLIKMKEEGTFKSKRSFKCIVFKEFSIRSVEMLNFVKTLLKLIDIDKILGLHLSISRQILLSNYSQIISLLNNKQNLQKLQLTVSNSQIDNQFLRHLFTLGGPRNHIYRIEFIQCKINVDHNVLMAQLPFIKSIIFIACKIKNLQFITKFSALNYLQFHSCSFENQLFQTYEIISKLTSLLSLSLVNIKKNLRSKQIYLSRFFQSLFALPKLQALNFSENQLDRSQLLYFSEHLHKIKIYQLNIYDFYETNIDTYIQSFLYHDNIKILNIQFKNNINQLFQSFINSLSMNKSIVKLNLKTEFPIQSRRFEKLQLNRKLQSIHSNHPLPNWLYNHIQNNITNKSVTALIQEAFQPQFRRSSKSEDFCRIGLSLDGGGARGLLLATSLDYIARKVNRPLHKIFDYMGGASIGGVLALASSGSVDGHHPLCTTSELMEIFQIYGDRIFPKTQFSNITNIFQTKYDYKSYEDMLGWYFKQCKLSDTLKQTNILVNAVNRLTNEDVIFRSLNSIFDRNQDFYLKDVARATSAAPTFFPSAEIKNVSANIRYSLLDGGVGLNNPSKLVIDDIIKITQNEANRKGYFLLSLGTGRLRKAAVPSNAGIKDLSPIIDSFTESANYFVEKDLSQNYRGHYMRVSPFIRLRREDCQLDNTSLETYSAYKQFALQAAEENYSHTIAFGKFKNQSFIEWLIENTDKKHEF